jgi:hypothetical protein
VFRPPRAAWERSENAASRSTPNRRREVGQIDNEVATLTRTAQKYLNEFEADELEGPLLQDRLEELADKQRALEERRAQISARTRDPRPFPIDTVSAVRQALTSTAGDAAMNARTKSLLSVLIKEIKLDGLSAKSTYRLPSEEAVRAPTGEVEAAGIEPASTIARRERLQA